MAENNMWKVKNERREIVFLYNRFIENEYGRKRGYRYKESTTYKIDYMAAALEQFVYSIYNTSNKDNQCFLEETLENLKIKYDEEELDNTSDIKELMLDVFDKCCIPSGEFDWISADDERQCNYIWSSLTLLSDSGERYGWNVNQAIVIEGEERDRSEFIESLHHEFSSNPYSEMHLQAHPKSSKDKFDNIILFFDLWRKPISYKEKLINQLFECWGKIKNNSKMIGWVNKNEILSSWVWDYIFKSFLNLKEPVWLDINASNKSDGEKLKKIAVITLFDLLTPKDRIVVMSAVTKSGTQQKYRLNNRDGDNERKVASIPLSNERKMMLNKMAKDSNRKIYEVVEELIENEYKKRY